MRLPDDDEIYDVDQTYLGPEGNFIGRLRYRALALGPVVFVLGLLMVAQTVGYSLLSVGLLIVIAPWVTGKIIDHTSGERPFGVLVNTAVHEVDARREDGSRQHVRGPRLRARRLDLGGPHVMVPGARWSWRTYANHEATTLRGSKSLGQGATS